MLLIGDSGVGKSCLLLRFAVRCYACSFGVLHPSPRAVLADTLPAGPLAPPTVPCLGSPQTFLTNVLLQEGKYEEDYLSTIGVDFVGSLPVLSF